MMLRRLLLDRRAASAAEFALILPLLMILTLGAIDVGRYMWAVNRAEKATQMGVRFAVVTDPVERALIAEDFVGKTVGSVTLTQGDIIPANALGTITCDDTQCLCVAPCLSAGTDYDGLAFNAIVDRMRLFDPSIQAANVRVSYSGAGLGFAGDPNGSDISPVVSVWVTGMTFSPVTAFLLTDLNLPDFKTSMTAEDMVGNTSN